MRSIDEIDIMALNLRNELGEDYKSPIDIFSLAKTLNNLTVVFCPLGKNISGMCIKEKGSHLIAINTNMSLGRQRFSLAHEFFHLRYDEIAKRIVSPINTNKEDEVEMEADLFASHFLMPSIALYEALKDEKEIKLSKVVWLEQHFGLSRQAMLVRLLQEKKINKRTYELFLKDVQRNASLLGYETELYNPTNKAITVGEYIRLAGKLYNENTISNGKYEELLLDAFREDLVYGESIKDEFVD